jgi:hypothetical protein
MAPAPGRIGTGIGIATAGVAAAVAAATVAAAIICEGDIAGRQMSAKQCDGGGGQRRTNDRGSREPLQPLW